jgi:hypothetical protein
VRDGLSGIAEWYNRRADEVDDPPSMEDSTPARGDDVPDPIDVVSVSERDNKVASVREHVDRGPVEPSARSTAVDDDTEIGQPAG